MKKSLPLFLLFLLSACASADTMTPLTLMAPDVALDGQAPSTALTDGSPLTALDRIDHDCGGVGFSTTPIAPGEVFAEPYPAGVLALSGAITCQSVAVMPGGETSPLSNAISRWIEGGSVYDTQPGFCDGSGCYAVAPAHCEPGAGCFATVPVYCDAGQCFDQPQPEPPVLLGGDPPPVSGAAPQWVQDAIASGWQVGEWAAISGPTPTLGLAPTNTMLAVNTAGDNAANLQEAFIDSWTGAVLASSHRQGVYWMGPGGSHNNYGKGTQYLFDLSTRTWEEVAGADASGLNSAFGEYNSGRPISNHSAFWPVYDQSRNEIVLPRGWGDPVSGSDQFPVAFGHGFNLTAYDSGGYSDALWRRYPELTGLTGTGGVAPTGQMRGLAQQVCSAYDRNRSTITVIGAHNSDSTSGLVAQYSSAIGQWTVRAPQWSLFLYSSCAVDPIRDVLVAPGLLGVKALDLANPDARAGSPTSTGSLWSVTNTGSVPAKWTQLGWEWSDALDGFVYYDQTGDSSVVRLAAYAGGDHASYALDWSILTSPTNPVVPPVAAVGSYNKFRLMAWGQTEVAFLAADADGAVYAFRVH